MRQQGQAVRLSAGKRRSGLCAGGRGEAYLHRRRAMRDDGLDDNIVARSAVENVRPGDRTQPGESRGAGAIRRMSPRRGARLYSRNPFRKAWNSASVIGTRCLSSG